MCMVSNTGDFYGQRFKPWEPYIYPYTPSTVPAPTTSPWEKILKDAGGPTQKEFDDLKKEVEVMKELLKRAKEYDEKNNEPNCEIEDKMKFLKAVAKLVNIDLDDVLSKQANGI